MYYQSTTLYQMPLCQAMRPQLFLPLSTSGEYLRSRILLPNAIRPWLKSKINCKGGGGSPYGQNNLKNFWELYYQSVEDDIGMAKKSIQAGRVELYVCM